MSEGVSSSQIIDLHSHLLPALDDGAKTPDHTFAMVHMAAKTGVSQIICTPHCVAGNPGTARKIGYIRRLVAAFNQAIARQNIPVTLWPGMELLCTDGLPQALERGMVLTLADSRYLLLEFPFDTPLYRMEWSAETVRQAGYVPVMAHPERYRQVWRNPECLGEWFDRGYVLQMSKDSILGRFGTHCARTADWTLCHGFFHVVASDAHGVHARTSDMAEVDRVLKKRYHPRYADLLLRRNPNRILENRPLILPGP